MRSSAELDEMEALKREIDALRRRGDDLIHDAANALMAICAAAALMEHHDDLLDAPARVSLASSIGGEVTRLRDLLELGRGASSSADLDLRDHVVERGCA